MQTQLPDTAMNLLAESQEVQYVPLVQARQLGMIEQGSHVDVDELIYRPTGQTQIDPARENRLTVLQVKQTEPEEHVKHPVMALEHKSQVVLVL